MVNSNGRSSMNRSACSSEVVTAPSTASFAGCSGRFPPLSQKYDPGLAASRRIAHTVALQIASLSDAATRPPTTAFTGVSSLRAIWKVAYERPRLTHCPMNAWLSAAGLVPAMRLSTVLAAWTPSGPAAWQLIRSGWPDGCGGVSGRHDARVVHAGQCFIGEQPAQRVGAKAAAGGQLRNAEARRPHRHQRWAGSRRR